MLYKYYFLWDKPYNMNFFWGKICNILFWFISDLKGIDRLTIENETNTGPHPYTSRLTLTDVSFVDVGFYECSYLDDDNGIYASFSYIFVEGNQILLRLFYSNQDSIIICKM